MWWNPWLLRVEQGGANKICGIRQGMIHGTPLTQGGPLGGDPFPRQKCGLKMGVTIFVPLFLAILKMEHDDELWWTHGFRGQKPVFFLTGLNWTARSSRSSPISPVRSVYRERSHLLPYGLSCGTPWAWEPSDPGEKASGYAPKS